MRFYGDMKRCMVGDSAGFREGRERKWKLVHTVQGLQ